MDSLTSLEKLYVKHWHTHTEPILKRITDIHLRNILPFISIGKGTTYCDEGELVTRDKRLEQEWKVIEDEARRLAEANACCLSYSPFISQIQTGSQLEILMEIDKNNELEFDTHYKCVGQLLADCIVNRKIDLFNKIISSNSFKYGLQIYEREWYRHTVGSLIIQHYSVTSTGDYINDLINDIKWFDNNLSKLEHKFIFKYDMYLSSFVSQNVKCIVACENFYSNTNYTADDFKSTLSPDDNVIKRLLTELGNHSDGNSNTNTIINIVSNSSFDYPLSYDEFMKSIMYKYLHGERFVSRRKDVGIKEMYKAMGEKNKLKLRFDAYAMFTMENAGFIKYEDLNNSDTRIYAFEKIFE